jgi:2-oxoglutarate dehydrogenase E1 component
MEQLYPFPANQLAEILNAYPEETELFWVQEEPLNMGASVFIQQQIGNQLARVIGRPASGVTAEGLTALHKINQAAIIEQAFSFEG